MATKQKFNLTDLLNQRSKEDTAGAAVEPTEAGDISPVAGPAEGTPGTADIYDLIPSKGNFYGVENVEDLKQSIELLGVLQPLLVTEPQEDGKRRIMAGHRRRLAVLQLVEEGKDQFRYVPILEKEEKNAILDRLALIMANRFREKTDWEKMTEAVETEDLVLKLKETVDIPGRTRDLLAEIIETSPAQVGRYKAIYNNLLPSLMAEFKANRIGVSVIYEVSGLSEDYQTQAAELYRENDILTLSDVKQLKKAEEAAQQIPGQVVFDGNGEPKVPEDAAAVKTSPEQDETDADKEMDTEEEESENEGTEDATEGEYIDPQPESVTSLCYSCNNYEECHDKKATVTSCNAYVNRTEANKTDQQRYDEEQAAIDRETARKLKEREQEAKMDQLPSDSKAEKSIRMSPAKMREVTVLHTRPYLIVKNERYSVGDTVRLIEFAEGRATGNMAEMKIMCMDDDNTSSALDTGYCVIALQEVATWHEAAEEAGETAAMETMQPGA